MMREPYAGWKEDVEKARIRHKVVTVAQGRAERTAYVTAEAGTGSRYAVVVTWLPPSYEPEFWTEVGYQPDGGRYAVAVLQPWQTAHVVDVKDLDLQYIAEHFLPEGRDVDSVHGGDLKALQITINDALRRVV